MILLISSKYDVTTNLVIDWLLYFKVKFHRINTENVSRLDKVRLSNTVDSLLIDGINIKNCKVIWHRRGRFRFIPKEIKNEYHLYRYLVKEENALIKSIELYSNENIKYIGSFINEDENYKINHLVIAKKVGLKIPETLITTEKKTLIKFKKKYHSIISKDIRYPVSFQTKDYVFNSIGTFNVSDKDIEDLPNNFCPILVQENISKEYEIRLFFIEDLFYPMAIFSQSNERTKLDFRNYDDEKPNRCVPVKIPFLIEEKIKRFIREVDINTGSMDIVVNKKNEYIFLEINPMGQLDWVSKNCNYYIEKSIAEHLTI